MKIKKLTIHGFKSFPDRTQFTFPSGTSAIVGPNGCGKSNIVDAIRWVLGEQNARHLRGKLMEDLIFGGSDSRKSMGMAEVALTLSNEEGNAPASYVNFTEIEIQRRLYKSGESEYLINRVPSRLRDIVELFTDTGIGTKAYSIIEQGQVGWLVSAKPEERRVLFEEAAGINKYRHKKEEALRKLESTKQNLLRVSDIIGEVKRQLNSLNRQAKKAERYELIKDELKETDLYLARIECNRIGEERGGIEKTLSAAEDREIALSAMVNKKEGAAGELNVEYLKKEDDYKQRRERAFELERLIAERERSIELARLRAGELENTSARLSADIEELGKEKAGAGRETAGLKVEIERLESLIGEEEKSLGENEAALESLGGALKEKEALLKEGETVSLQSSAKLSDIKYSIRNCLREEEALRAKETKLGGECEELKKAISHKGSSLEGLKGMVEGLRRRKISREAEITSAMAMLADIEDERLHKAEELKSLLEAIAGKRARLEAIKEMTPDGIMALIEGRGIPGVHGVVSDFIEASPGYEKAVEATLGERLNYVIVESPKQGVEAVEYLKKNSVGRTGFIPVRESRPLKVDDRIPDGTLDLKDKVRVKNGYSDVIKNLLEGVVVTDSFHGALAMWEKNGISKTLVTPEGDMIDPQGVITGGCANISAGALQKRKEIKELTSDIEKIGKELSILEGEIKEMDSAVNGSKALIDDLKERLFGDDIERVESEAEKKKAEDELKGLEGKFLGVSLEIAATQRELDTIKDKKGILSGEMESLESEGGRREEFIKALSDEVNSLKEKKEEKARLSTETRVVLASSVERFGHLKDLLKSKEESVKEMERKVISKKEEIEAGRREIEAKGKEAGAIKALLLELLVKKDALKKEEVLGGEELSSLASRIKSMEGECRALREELSAVAGEKAELSLRQRELALTLTNLKEKIIERYGTNIEGYSPPKEIEERLAATPRESLIEKTNELRKKIGEMGEVSLSALEEYRELEERHNFLLEQQSDLVRSVETLQSAISRINRITRERFEKTFDEINRKFMETFPRFFSGGRAELRLVGEDDILESGIDIIAQPPGKKLQNISLLSGGEKALTATALIFSIFSIKPSPFCLLDEVDAPLDDANVDRFNGFVKEMSGSSQFMLITHNKRTMEMADTLFGITMEEPGVSKVVAVNL